MPIERQQWQPATDWPTANGRLRRVVDVLDRVARVEPIRATSSGEVALTVPSSLVEGDTTAGAVTLTFPDARTVPGFRVDVVKVTGASALVANGVTVTTYAGWISSGAAWRRVA